jgi:hypothetical protein
MTLPARHPSSCQTINGRLLRFAEPGLARPTGKPDVSSTTTNINVRFASPFRVDIPIRHHPAPVEIYLSCE